MNHNICAEKYTHHSLIKWQPQTKIKHAGQEMEHFQHSRSPLLLLSRLTWSSGETAVLTNTTDWSWLCVYFRHKEAHSVGFSVPGFPCLRLRLIFTGPKLGDCIIPQTLNLICGSNQTSAGCHNLLWEPMAFLTLQQASCPTAGESWEKWL